MFFCFYQICPKWEFPVKNGKIALERASVIVTFYIKLFRTGVDRNNGILMSLLLLVAETISQATPWKKDGKNKTLRNGLMEKLLKKLKIVINYSKIYNAAKYKLQKMIFNKKERFWI